MTRRRRGLAASGIAPAFRCLGGERVSIRARVPENHFTDAERCPLAAIHLAAGRGDRAPVPAAMCGR